MTTSINHIDFDPSYGRSINWILFLYQLDTIGPVIPVPDAHLMRFIQVFNNIIDCHIHISNNLAKEIVLYILNENFHIWLTRQMNIPNNIKTMKILCPEDGCVYYDYWVKRYRYRYPNTNYYVITFNQLNHDLLTSSLKCLRVIRREFPAMTSELNQLEREINDCLNTSVLQRINQEDERIQLGEQPRL